ncbi:4-alpha-glucanotransferase [Pseudomonas sp. HR96]|uniref:4-alpha-glucanotransferase n=1 Tax=Pseudomonas sp. HR96 TaxID=1027966 RepID=UPI002A75F30D|nr:4-alpha-glucanotransferase [Pseudomonas sp. HR96]WPO97988.1 4-alpha-glucanotransferase [Pseudomonas sp. HR96]
MTDALHKLADHAGLAVHWTDANGRPQQVSDDVLRKVLAGLGHPADSDEAVAASLDQLQQLKQGHHLPPLLTVDYGKPLPLGQYFKPGTGCQVHLEDGATLDLHLDDLGNLPGMIPVGYQDVRIDGQHFTMAVAPARCYNVADAVDSDPARAWGLSAQLYSLRREGDGGFGDTQALESLVRAAGERGADAVAISPMHAMCSADNSRYSPYSPSSRLFLNSLYAAPGTILGERAVRLAIEAAGLAETLHQLEALPLIDWPAAASAKQRLLRALYDAFIASEHPLNNDFSSFRHHGGEALENHCRFEAIQALRAAAGESLDWRQWPDELHDPRSMAVARFAREHSVEVGFYAFCQWLVDRSLTRAQAAARAAGMRIGLVADLAVGADGAGSQAWSFQDELLSALTVGAPPDILNRAGQGWGISAFSPEGLVRNGFRAFIEMLRANFAHAGGLRIDHVMGLQRLWVIPVGSPPNEGAYLHYPIDDMLRLLTLESHRHKAIVLGEDLGTVPDGLREKLAARHMLGMRVLLFEQSHTGHFRPVQEWPDDALATSTTHDLPTLNGWWRARDIDWNRKLELIDHDTEQQWRVTREHERRGLKHLLTQDAQNFKGQGDEVEQLIDASVRFLGHTPAPLVLLPLDDALGIEEQANLPGTIDSHPNWRRRYKTAVQTLLDDSDAARRLELLACARQQAQERDR